MAAALYGLVDIEDRFTPGLAKADKAGKSFAESVSSTFKSVGQSMSELGGSITMLSAPIAGFFAASVKAASDYQDALTQLDASLASTATQTEQTTASQDTWSEHTVLSGKKLEKLHEQLDKANAHLTDLQANWDKAKHHTASATLALENARAKVADLNSQFAAGSEVVKTHTGAIAASTPVLQISRDALLAYADQMDRTTRFSKEAIITGESMMLTFEGLGSEIFPQAMTAALDLSTKMKQDLKSSIVQIGKALAMPEKGITALTRVGVVFTEQQKDEIKALAKSGNLLAAQKMILAELTKEFGGSAVAAGKTWAGQLEIINHQFTDMQDIIGAAVMPALSGLLDQVKPIIQAVSEWATHNPELIQGIAMLAFGAAGLGTSLMVLGPVVGAIGTLIGFMLSPIGLLIAGVAALGVAFNTNFLGIHDVLEPAIQTAKTFFDTIGFSLQAAIGQLRSGANLGDVIKTWLGGFSTYLGEFVSQNAPKLLAAFDDMLVQLGGWLTFGGGLGKFMNGLAGLITGGAKWLASGGWSNLQSGAEGLLGSFMAWLGSDGPQWLITGIRTAFGQLGNWISTSAWPFVRDGATAFFQSISDFFENGGMDQLVQGITNAMAGVAAWIQGGDNVNTLQNSLNGLVQNLGDFFEKIGIDKLVLAIGNAFGHMVQWVLEKGLPLMESAFETVVVNILQILGKIADGIVKSITDGISKGIDAAKNAVNGALGGGGSSTFLKGVAANLPFGLGGIASSLFRDSGGQGAAGQPYLIGRGAQPEMFVPKSAGTFVPNADKMGGSANVTITLNVTEGNARQAGWDFGGGLGDRLRANGLSAG